MQIVQTAFPNSGCYMLINPCFKPLTRPSRYSQRLTDIYNIKLQDNMIRKQKILQAFYTSTNLPNNSGNNIINTRYMQVNKIVPEADHYGFYKI